MMGSGIMLEFIVNFLSNTYVGQPTLHTRKIDQNIARLQQYDWFQTIYYDDQYRSLFFANRHVRKYLQSTFRVKRMMKKKQAQARFIRFLNKQLK
jgi:hypothetical protein